MPFQPTRRDLLISAAAFAAAGAAPARADAPKNDSVRVGKAVVTSFAFSTVDVGIDAGIWKALNLDIDAPAFRGDAQVQEALTGGSLDIGLGSGPAMAYRTKGVPAIAVASMAGRPQDMALVVAKGGDIKKVADLKGKRIGVTTAGSLTDWLARQLASDQGWGADGVTVVPLGSQEVRVAALANGQIAASVHDSTEAFQLEQLGKGTIITLFGDIVKDFETHVIFATDTMVAQRPAVLQRFLKGWFQTVAYMRTHKDQTIKSVARAMHVDESVVAKSYPADMQMMSSDGAFNLAGIEVVRRSVKDLGIYDGTLDPKNMYTTRFVPVKV